jgi:beta-glucosidase
MLREAEGYDRTTLDLPGRTNELIERIAEVNSLTIVVTQSVWAAASSSCVHSVDIV